MSATRMCIRNCTLDATRQTKTSDLERWPLSSLSWSSELCCVFWFLSAALKYARKMVCTLTGFLLRKLTTTTTARSSFVIVATHTQAPEPRRRRRDKTRNDCNDRGSRSNGSNHNDIPPQHVNWLDCWVCFWPGWIRTQLIGNPMPLLAQRHCLCRASPHRRS